MRKVVQTEVIITEFNCTSQRHCKKKILYHQDRLCGLVVRVSGYRYRGPGFDPRRYQIF